MRSTLPVTLMLSANMPIKVRLIPAEIVRLVIWKADVVDDLAIELSPRIRRQDFSDGKIGDSSIC